MRSIFSTSAAACLADASTLWRALSVNSSGINADAPMYGAIPETFR
jgi:hypothetical protein